MPRIHQSRLSPLATLLLLCLAAAPACLGDLGAGTVWPMPRTLTVGQRQLLFTADTQFTLSQPTCLLVQDAIVRVRRTLEVSALPLDPPSRQLPRPAFSMRRSPSRPAAAGGGAATDAELSKGLPDEADSGVAAMRMLSEPLVLRHVWRQPSLRIDQLDAISLVTIAVQEPCDETDGRQLYPNVSVDESYSISFSGSQVTITAQEPWGAMYGLETFSQLVVAYPDGSLRVNETQVADNPRFAHRGVLLDSSRHYLPMKTILQNLDAMAYNKMNVFHWHIVDDESFPYQSYTFPALSDKGAFTGRHVYSQQDVADVIEYARRRGIRVVPEFDTPGHTLSWGAGQPGLLTPCYNSKGQPDGTFGPVDPTKESTYTFLNSLLSELRAVFPDSYLHLGGDEVPFTCWQSNPSVQQFMKDHGFGQNYSLLESYYENRLIAIATGGSGHSAVVWQELLDNAVSLPPSTIVHVWKGGWQQEMATVTSRGFPALLSSCWYFDYISLEDWRTFYACEPLDFPGTPAQKAKVIGGEACLWGEFVDASNAISQLWPRASTTAERLWSNLTSWDPAAAEPRLAAHRCRMLYRGLNTEPTARKHMCLRQMDLEF